MQDFMVTGVAIERGQLLELQRTWETFTGQPYFQSRERWQRDEEMSGSHVK